MDIHERLVDEWRSEWFFTTPTVPMSVFMAQKGFEHGVQAVEKRGKSAGVAPTLAHVDELMRCVSFLHALTASAETPAHMRPSLFAKAAEIEEVLGIEPQQPPLHIDFRTLEEKLGAEFEEKLSAVITAAYNNAAMDLVKDAPYGCAEEEAEYLRMCVAEMMGFQV